MMSSSWFVVLLCLKTLKGMEVGFLESDISVHEGEGSLRVVVSSRNLLTDMNVSIQVIPMNLTQFTATGRPLPQGVSLADDPAEEGFDFDSSVHDVLLVSGIEKTFINVPIIDDMIAERDEVFLLMLRLAGVHPKQRKSEVSLYRNVTIVHIVPRLSDMAVVSLSARELVVSEGDGPANGLLYVDVDREIEPDTLVTLSIQKLYARDIEFPQMNILIPSKTRRIPVPFHVTDDEIAEFNEHVIMTLKRHEDYTSLYRVKHRHNKVDISIEDNDVPRIGFKMNGTVVDSMEMAEGESEEVCVSLLEPELFEAYFLININILAKKSSMDAVSVSQKELIILSSGIMTKCFQVHALDDIMVNSAHNVVLALEITLVPSLTHVHLGRLNISVKDNDGPPIQPSDVNISRTGAELHVTWESHVTKFKPVEKFIILVQQSKSYFISSAISHRQIDMHYQEYETNETFLTVKIDVMESYFISVCALNHDWKVCSEPIQSQAKNLDKSTSLRLNGSESKSNWGLGTVIIVAVITGPLVALLLAILLIFIVILCRCWRESQQYSPSHQEKCVIGTARNIETKAYYPQRSSNSNLSTEWTLISPNDYITELLKEPRIQSHIAWGTPV